MTVGERNEKLREIERLSKSLKSWLETPMLESVKKIGAEAIRCRMSELSRPLRMEDSRGGREC